MSWLDGAMETIRSWPFAVAALVLFGIAMARGQLLYWLGFLASSGASARLKRPLWLRRWLDWLNEGGVDSGVRLLRRWGLITVPLSYLTVGLQSVLQAAAGVIRVPAWKYALAQLPGAAVWAVFYTLVGLVVWKAAVDRPALLAVLAIIAVGVIYGVRRHRLRAAKSTSAQIAVPQTHPSDRTEP